MSTVATVPTCPDTTPHWGSSPQTCLCLFFLDFECADGLGLEQMFRVIQLMGEILWELWRVYRTRQSDPVVLERLGGGERCLFANLRLLLLLFEFLVGLQELSKLVGLAMVALSRVELVGLWRSFGPILPLVARVVVEQLT